LSFLFVTITNHLYIIEHGSRVIKNVLSRSTHSKFYAAIGMCDDALKVIYKSVVIATVLHAIPAWWGFTAASNRQKLDAFIHRGFLIKFYIHNDPTMAELVDKLDETLFTNDGHVLRYILPDRRNNNHTVLDRSITTPLTIRRDSRNFFQRLV